MNNGKKLSIRVQLLLMSVLPIVIIGTILLIVISSRLRAGMMDQALDGLMASAEMFKEQISLTDKDISTNEIEDECKAATGYDFTRFEGDTRASTSVKKADGSRPIGTKASPEVVEAVLKRGEKFTSQKTDVAGEEYCVAYTPIKDESGRITGMAFAGKPTAEMNETIRKSIISIVGVGITIIIITIVIVYIIADKLVSAVLKINNVINKLSVGEFVKTQNVAVRNDELGEMLNSSNVLIDALTGVINDVKNISFTLRDKAEELNNTCAHLRDSSEGVSCAVQDMADGAMEQAESVEKVTQKVDDLSQAIRDVAENTDSLAGSTSDMGIASKESAKALEELSESMNSMKMAVAQISATMRETNQAVRSVNEKVDGINNIAEQTNLLALNASIEAARAGESGRGFAVVAQEIGMLANESSHTADEIRSEMMGLLHQAENACDTAEQVAGMGDDVSRVLGETVVKIKTLIDGVNSTVSRVENISLLTETCDTSKLVIVDEVNSLSAISQEYAATTQETSASMVEINNNIGILASSAEDLMNVAQKLDEDLEFFKL